MIKITALILTIIGILGIGLAIYFIPGTSINYSAQIKEVVLDSETDLLDNSVLAGAVSSTINVLESTNISTSTKSKLIIQDIEPQEPLPNPPNVIKAVYATGFSAGSPAKIQYFINLIKSTELNAIVIDIKDFSGHVLYNIQNKDINRYNAKDVRIPQINKIIKHLHDEGIYVIARQTVFQDPVLAAARPDLAIQKEIILAPAVIETRIINTTSSLQNGELIGEGNDNKIEKIVITPTSTKRITWVDRKNLAWIDPGARDAWDYNIEIAKDASARGFDEINFDYVRFPSDGDLNSMRFSHYDFKNQLKLTQMENFFKYLRKETEGIVISADLFGLVTVDNGDLGIGQNLKIASKYFDVMAPMIYPSHYAKGFIGYSNPAEYPREVVTYSLEQALKKIFLKSICADISMTTSSMSSSEEDTASSSNANTTLSLGTASSSCRNKQNEYMNTKIRPWLQDFNMGALYGANMVRLQINAVDKTIKDTSVYNGWMLWNPSNVYTKGALELK